MNAKLINRTFKKIKPKISKEKLDADEKKKQEEATAHLQ